MLDSRSRNHNIHFAKNSIAHRALLQIGTRSAGGADIPTAAVALLTGRNLGVLVTLAALDVHRFRHHLHLLHIGFGLTPYSRPGDDLAELAGRLVGPKIGLMAVDCFWSCSIA